MREEKWSFGLGLRSGWVAVGMRAGKMVSFGGKIGLLIRT
jgi:hypothetical protein